MDNLLIRISLPNENDNRCGGAGEAAIATCGKRRFDSLLMINKKLWPLNEVMTLMMMMMILCQFSGRRPFEDKPGPHSSLAGSTLMNSDPLWLCRSPCEEELRKSWKNQNRFSSTITTPKWPPLRAFLQTVFAKWSIHTQDHFSYHLLKDFSCGNCGNLSLAR